MVAGHPWTATSIDEVASSEATPSEAQFECCSSATRDHVPVESVGCAPEEVSSRGPCGRFDQDSSHPGGDCESWTRRRRGTGHIGNRVGTLPLVDKRIADTEAFIARAQKRVAAEAAKIFEAEKQKQLFEEELVQAEKDSEGFRREAETFQVSGGRQIPVDPTSSLEAEFARVRAELAQLKGAGTDPDAPCVPVVKRTCRMGDGRAVIPAELSAWLEERHADLQDALVTGDNNRILELTTKLSEGAERMIEMVGGMVS